MVLKLKKNEKSVKKQGRIGKMTDLFRLYTHRETIGSTKYLQRHEVQFPSKFRSAACPLQWNVKPHTIKIACFHARVPQAQTR
jgi:hypothetical protein